MKYLFYDKIFYIMGRTGNNEFDLLAIHHLNVDCCDCQLQIVICINITRQIKIAGHDLVRCYTIFL